MRVGIIGGGAAGLAAAYELTKQGHYAEVFERATFLGGQASTFPVGGGQLERGYHHLFVSDTDMTELVHELGLGHKLAWLESKVGLFYDGKIWDFATPMDLLRFKPLSLIERLRVGWWTFVLQKTTNWRKFEHITATEWLKTTHGEPGLRGHLGAAAAGQVRRVLRPGKHDLVMGKSLPARCVPGKKGCRKNGWVTQWAASARCSTPWANGSGSKEATSISQQASIA